MTRLELAAVRTALALLRQAQDLYHDPVRDAATDALEEVVRRYEELPEGEEDDYEADIIRAVSH